MRIRQLLLAAVWCACGNVGAQPSSLSLADAQRAAAANIDVVLARHALAAARGDVLSADHAPAPVITAKTSSIDLQNGVGGGNLLRDKRIDKSLGVDVMLERGNKRELRTRAARLGVEASRADLREAVVQQQLVASAAWYDLLAAQERVVQVEAIQNSGAQLAATAQRRVNAGDLSRQDATRVEIEAQRARADLQAAQADRQKAELALARATGAGPQLTAAGTWPPLDPAPRAQPPDIALRADVRAAEERAQAARAALDSALALRKPDVTVGASIDHFPGTSTRQVELRLQVPLSGGFVYAFEGEIARARAQSDQAQAQLEKVRRDADADVRRLGNELQTASARAATYQNDIVPRARQVAEMAEFAYGRGSMSLTELIDARRTLRTVLLEETASRADYGRALAAWQLRLRPPEPDQD